jgi:hypothetical protein
MGYNISAALWIDGHGRTLMLVGLLAGVGLLIMGPPLIGRAVIAHQMRPMKLRPVLNGGLDFFAGDNSTTVPLATLRAPEVREYSEPRPQSEEQPEAEQGPTSQPEADPYLRIEVPASESEPMPLAAVAFDTLVRSGALSGVGQDVEADMEPWGYVDEEFDWTWDWKLAQMRLETAPDDQLPDEQPDVVPAAIEAAPVQTGLDHGDYVRPKGTGDVQYDGGSTSCAVPRLGLTSSPRDRFVERNRGPRLIRLPWMAGDGLALAGAARAANADRPNDSYQRSI